jgi:hypothetical protein
MSISTLSAQNFPVKILFHGDTLVGFPIEDIKTIREKFTFKNAVVQYLEEVIEERNTYLLQKKELERQVKWLNEKNESWSGSEKLLLEKIKLMQQEVDSAKKALRKAKWKVAKIIIIAVIVEGATLYILLT